VSKGQGCIKINGRMSPTSLPVSNTMMMIAANQKMESITNDNIIIQSCSKSENEDFLGSLFTRSLSSINKTNDSCIMFTMKY
jgi:hypothetical protein